MTDHYSHLGAKAKALIAEPNDVRIMAIQQGAWIKYPRATEILERMERLLKYPRVTRMPNMLIVGSTNNGKSSIVEHFAQQHLPDMNPEGDAAIAPVVLIEAPPTPDVSDFYGRILEELFAPFRPNAKVADLYRQVKLLFVALHVKMLIVDEIQHLIAGSLAKQRDFRNALKSLGNETGISIVASGIEEAFNAFNTDPQLSNRFVPELLPKWRMDNTYGSLLMTLERRMPLKLPSKLPEPDLAQKILWMSEGTLGDICDLVKLAAEQAIIDGSEKITDKLLDALPWVPPSKRKQQPRTL